MTTDVEIQKTRLADIQLMFGESMTTKAQNAKVLMVGAGGIGCELLKNLVMSGFENITVIDLDTIDLSNLNRQFLFHKEHIKKPKAFIARDTCLKFNPAVKITAYHDSIFEPKYDLDWFKSFDFCMNALDNLAARRYVNKMCLAVGIPLIESGTAGYLGQVSVHQMPYKCYDCTDKPVEKKTYPVCTIRSTPSAPVHCIVWAKSFLFNVLFGKLDDDEEATMSTEGADQQELKKLNEEADQLKKLRLLVGKPSLLAAVFDKVYHSDIKRLLDMENLWKTRKPPTILKSDQFKKAKLEKLTPLEFDQKVLSLEGTFTIFADMLNKIGKRVAIERGKNPDYFIEFDKDDEDSLSFVTAAANLRAHCFSIPMQSRFNVKEIAGNIIPAIATTNAIVAGMMVMLAFKILAGKIASAKNTYVVYGGERKQFLLSENIEVRNPNCPVCSNNYIQMSIPENTKLQKLVEIVTKELNLEGDITVQVGERLLYDVEFDDNLLLTLKELGIQNSCINITNDAENAEDCFSIEIYLQHGKTVYFKGNKELIPRAQPPTATATEVVPEEVTNPAKRQKVDQVVLDDFAPIDLD